MNIEILNIEILMNYKDLGLFENNKDLSALHKNLSGIRNAESSGSTEHTHKL